MPDCHRVIARIEARLNFLEPLCATNPAACAEAESLRPMLPAAEDGATAPDGDSEPVCLACRMLAGDVNLDGTVDAEDVSVFLLAWADGNLLAADLNRDGWSDHEDLAIILSAVAMQQN